MPAMKSTHWLVVPHSGPPRIRSSAPTGLGPGDVAFPLRITYPSPPEKIRSGQPIEITMPGLQPPTVAQVGEPLVGREEDDATHSGNCEDRHPGQPCSGS